MRFVDRRLGVADGPSEFRWLWLYERIKYKLDASFLEGSVLKVVMNLLNGECLISL
jgi:hypothetical protein